MENLQANYEAAIAQAEDLLTSHGLNMEDFVQCDALCYRAETNQRYDELKQEFSTHADMIDETIIAGRNIAVFSLHTPLTAGQWNSIQFIELPQPKEGSPYPEGIDHVKFVTRTGLSQFRKKYAHVPFDEKGLANKLNQLLRIKSDGVGVKLHDKHMGAVIDLEHELGK